MTYEERVALAKADLIEFLDAYVPPRGLDEEGQVKRITQIAESFARNMPTEGEYPENLQRCFTRVMDAYDGHHWPTQARFVAAMSAGSTVQGKQAPRTFVPDDYALWIKKKMAKSDPVPEPALWGETSKSLQGDLLERYRSASVMFWRGMYKHDAYSMMRSRFGDVVEPYFREGA